MAQAPVALPQLYQTTRPQALQITAKSDGTNTFVANQFMKLASGNLATVVADATNGGFGLSLDASHASTDEPYTMPFGEQHNVLGLQESTFLVNVCTSARAIGTGTSSALTVGSNYGITYFTTSGYTNVAALNVSNTTAAFFTLVGFYANDATTDTNARVLVRVTDAATSV
jgi:hypothetical protein